MNAPDIIFSGHYNPFYFIGLVTIFCIAWLEGLRKGWPKDIWLVLLAFGIVGGIAGTKILRFDLISAAHGDKTILGGVLGGALAMIFALRFLRFNWRAFDTLSIAIPIGVAISRIGCFRTGCCFGVPTLLPWGVKYSLGTPAYSSQLTSGLIDLGAITSLPVHPTQLYDAGFNILLALVLLRWRKHFRKPGSAFMAYCVGYGVIRFFVEFYRVGGGTEFLGIKTVQWMVAFAVVVVMAMLVYSEKRKGSLLPKSTIRSCASSDNRTLALLVFMVGATVLAGQWFTPLEKVAVAAVIIPGLIVVSNLRLRRAGIVAAPGYVAALIMLQPRPAAQDTTTYPHSYFTVGGSGMTGKYWTESCGGDRTYYNYSALGVSGSYNYIPNQHTSYSARTQLYLGSEKEGGRTYSFKGIGIKAQADWHYIGLGLGVLAEDYKGNGPLPIVGIRLGSLSGFFLDGRILDHEPSPLPLPGILLGIGFGSPTGNTTRLGISGAGFYFQGNYLTETHTEISPFIAFGDANTFQLGLAVRYRLYAPHRRP